MGLAGLIGEDALHVVFQELDDDPRPAKPLLSGSWEVAVDEGAVIVYGHDPVDGLADSVHLPRSEGNELGDTVPRCSVHGPR